MFFTNVVLLFFLIFAVLAFTDRDLPMPTWLSERVQTRLSEIVAPAAMSVGRIAISVDRDGVPRTLLKDVVIRDPSGAEVARLNQMTARLAPKALMSAQIAPSRIRLSGAQITLRRDVDGNFAVAFDTGREAASLGPSAIVAAIDDRLASGPLAYLKRIEMQDVTVALEDARSGRIWQVSNAEITLETDAETLSASVISEVFNGTENLAQVQISIAADRDNHDIELGASITGMPAGDLALQSPALSFLRVLDADIDGSVRASLDPEGLVQDVAATLEISKGALQPQPNATYAFDSARAYLSYDPKQQRISFSNLSMTSELLEVSGQGHAYLRDLDGAWPSRLVGQLQLTEAKISGDDFLENDVVFGRGAADVNLVLSPFSATFGQIVLQPGDSDTASRISARGSVKAAPEGWDVAIDFSSPELSPDEVLALWPLQAIDGARRWTALNVLDGSLRNVSGALRHVPEADPQISVRFDVHDATVRFLEHFPPMRGAYARGTYENGAYTMYLARGRVRPEAGGPVNLAGSVFRIGDTQPRFPQAYILLKTESSLEAALRLLNNRPFEVLQKSGLEPDLARARAVSQSDISFELRKNVRKETVAFVTKGALLDVTSDTLVPSLPLAARRLDVEIDPDALVISGSGAAGPIPVQATWRQALAAEAQGRSRLEAQVPLSVETLRAFNVDLADAELAGVSTALLEMDLGRDAPGALVLTSDLVGLRASIPGIGWSKNDATPGRFLVEGTLDPKLTLGRLELSAPGLSASGTPVIGEDGEIGGLDLDNVQIGDWFDGQVSLNGGADAAPRIAILGGRIDLRERDGESEGSGPGAAIDVALDELVITETLSLRPFIARMPGAGQPGRFDARINGRSAVEGDLIPQGDRTAFRIRAEDAGAAFADSGILRGATGGALNMTLVPATQPGSFDGQLIVSDTVLRDAPTAAQLLDAVSIVGLIDELSGPGIRFDTVDARFWLGEDQLRVYQASAVGPSIGISMDGTYDLVRKTMDMQGVVSPLYVLNSVGSVLTRRGEGLFGMSFRMTGPSTGPSVTVNPLSILTPGMFRDIFRRPPPETAPSQ